MTRRRAARRRVVNEQDLLPVLREFGFEVIETERLSFHEQIQLFSHAEAVVGPHGAGLANLCFAPEGCKVLEFFDPHCVRVMYWVIADILQQPYSYVLGRTAGRAATAGADVGFNDFSIDPADLRQTLQTLFA